MDSSSPLVSVVIPTLNEEKYLPRPLESFKKQTYKNFELIISDGNSTDGTHALAKKYGASVVSSPNTTVTMARQKGAEAARGEIIVGADADTKYPPDHLERIVKDFARYPEAVVVGSGGIFEPNPWWCRWGWKLEYAIIAWVYRIFHVVLYLPAFNMSYRKSVFMKIGGYNTYLDFGGDELDILDRLKKEGKIIYDTKLYAYPSSRRAKEGFWRLMIKHTLIDYYGGYIVAKIFKKPLIKGKPIR
jgi:glycosyltransferase involved in cell wall biosynthesis